MSKIVELQINPPLPFKHNFMVCGSITMHKVICAVHVLRISSVQKTKEYKIGRTLAYMRSNRNAHIILIGKPERRDPLRKYGQTNEVNIHIKSTELWYEVLNGFSRHEV